MAGKEALNDYDAMANEIIVLRQHADAMAKAKVTIDRELVLPNKAFGAWSFFQQLGGVDQSYAGFQKMMSGLFGQGEAELTKLARAVQEVIELKKANDEDARRAIAEINTKTD